MGKIFILVCLSNWVFSFWRIHLHDIDVCDGEFRWMLRGGVPRMQKLGDQGYQRFPLSKPVVGQNIALHAVPVYRASMPTWFLPFWLIQLHFIQISPNLRRWNLFWVRESEYYLLVVGIILFRPDMTLRGWDVKHQVYCSYLSGECYGVSQWSCVGWPSASLVCRLVAISLFCSLYFAGV